LPSPNLLLNQPPAAAPDKVWAGDITYIPVDKDWMYLAVVIDLCSRKIVGWALADHMRSAVFTDALRQALEARRPVPGLIFHSDRASQYGSREYRGLLARSGIRQSMSARANPYHNAHTESFMGTLKTELIQDGCFIDGRTPAPSSSTTSRPTTTPTAATPRSNTSPRPNLRPLKNLLTKPILVQNYVAPHFFGCMIRRSASGAGSV
jgi:transposase InsO family protein